MHNRQKILLILASIALLWLFSSHESFPQPTKENHPAEDTAFLLESLKKLNAAFDKALWEAVATGQSPVREQEWLSGVKELEQAFGLPAAEPVRHNNRHWEYVNQRELEQIGRFSLRYLGIPSGNGAYQAHLILKLESTAADLPALEEFANSNRKKLNELGYNVTFFSCLSGTTDDTLETVRNRLFQAFRGQDAQLAEEYGDAATYAFRVSGSRQMQILIHWNGVSQKTEITLGTPLIITEF